jgi:hypothetical protein
MDSSRIPSNPVPSHLKAFPRSNQSVPHILCCVLFRIMSTSSVLVNSRSGTMLICCLCPGAISWRDVHLHLFKAHKMLQTERNVVLTGFQPDATKIDNNITPKQINVASLPDNSPVEPALPIFDGFRCNYCDYTTLSKELITRHLRKQHSHRRDPFSPVDIISRHYAAVRVQCWRPASAGKPRQYWTVCED